ncbi:hypothetical protein [Deinococcus humi]|uniref:Uncharacterized protein n=1 Tax=Deinococcus humi TaxID=662880 RepID=A0A7W8NHZ5_9DEIO|nr:hypothetical protein [Deinococcus humi]MBB5365293.1 hypothetical protein [Deinococcus humi]
MIAKIKFLAGLVDTVKNGLKKHHFRGQFFLMCLDAAVNVGERLVLELFH